MKRFMDTPSSCRICASHAIRFHLSTWRVAHYTESRVTYMRCEHCGCVQDCGDFPDSDSLMEEFPYLYIESGAGVYHFCSILHMLRNQTGVNGTVRLLDLGGAFGINAHMARTLFGWDVLSADIAPICAHGADALALPAYTGFASKETLGGRQFDVIVCTDVLEHVSEPDKLLATARDLLAPSGVLALGTPNADVLGPVCVEDEWPDFCFLGHYNLFGTRALADAFEAAGLTPQRQFLHWGSTDRKHIVALAGPQKLIDSLEEYPSIPRITPLFLSYCEAVLAEAPRTDYHLRYQNGLRFRRIETLVHAGRYDKALPYVRGMDAELARLGISLDEAAPKIWTSIPAYRKDLPTFLGRYMLVRGFFALNHEQDRRLGWRCFDIAAESLQTMRRAGLLGFENDIYQAIRHRDLFR